MKSPPPVARVQHPRAQASLFVDVGSADAGPEGSSAEAFDAQAGHVRCIALDAGGEKNEPGTVLSRPGVVPGTP